MFVFTFLPFLGFGRAKVTDRDSLKTLILANYNKDIFDNHKDVLRYSTELYYLAKNKNDQESIMFSLFEQSRIYFMENKYGVTLKKLYEGICLAKKMKDYNMLCRFTLIYQKVLTHLDYNNSEIKIFIDKCNEFNTLVKSKDDQHINTIYILVATADSYLDNEGLCDNMDKVIALKTQAYKESLKIKNNNPLKTFTQIYALQSLYWSCALSRNFNKANYYLAITDSLLAKNPNYYFNVDCLITKGAIENIQRNHQKAIYYFKQAIDKAEKSQAIYQLYTVFPMISASYGELNDFREGMEYSWKAKDMNEQLRQLRIEGHNATIITNINTEIHNMNSKQEIPYNFIAIGILIGSSSLYYYFNKKKVSRRNLLISLEEPQQNYSENYLEKIITESDAEDNKKLVNLAKEDINTFYIEFEKTYPAFQTILKEKHFELNLSDINFCSLIKMKFDMKQIATYTNTTLRSVESRRYRIRKKMQLKGQDDLYIIISNIN
ncbi:hypothetical protein ACM46_22370 [Chryseobacterium angstadtii]|uniref:HTH luxR-type domain-containing protein n=1 Tax=Chryseobacterium angstadtii TaxID=558151 RepID=A0A0J7HXH4_9FLAO|nr:hypothetical protein [Chryseobacterium angstadtii]KMQ58449.1 hypothetical protein ACM46_22370 [Chryseobacterium angstadtii]